MSEPAFPHAMIELLTLKEALAQLDGKIGRTKLLQHIAAVPRWGGGPTHLRNGRKILFRPDDLRRLLESLECPSVPRAGVPSTEPLPSADRAYARAMKLLAPSGRKPTTKAAGTSPRAKR